MCIAGSILRVDLTEGKITRTPTAPYVKDYLGGVGIAARIFFEEVSPAAKAFDPENLLIFSAGILTGTLLGNKGEVCSKTPEQANNPFVHIGFGGQFPSEMKFAGYDQIVIKGRAARPVYLYINNDQVEVRDARHLKGLDVHQTQRTIKAELGDEDIQVACIGPAGENLVVCAMVVTDIDNSASKRGMGAVMGSKNLKAVAVRGTHGLKINDPKAFKALFDDHYSELTKGQARGWGKVFHEENFARSMMDGYAMQGDKNSLPLAVPPSPTKDFLDKYVVSNSGCAFCPLQCHQNFSVPGIGNSAAVCVNWFPLVSGYIFDSSNHHLWWQFHVLCEKYGLDSLYVEMLYAWLMDLYSNGVITIEDTAGIPIVKNNAESMIAFIQMLAGGEGFGKILSDGIVPAAEKLGRGSLDYANQYGNSTTYLAPGTNFMFVQFGPVANYKPGDFEHGGMLPIDGYAHALPISAALGISPRAGTDLVDEWSSQASEKWAGDRNAWKDIHQYEKLILIAMGLEDASLFGDVAGHCAYTADWYPMVGNTFGMTEYARALTAATGTAYSREKLQEVSHRIRMLIDSYRVMGAHLRGEQHVECKGVKFRDCQGLINCLPVGPASPWTTEIRKNFGEIYCRMRGYDPVTGIPTRPTLEKLGLKDVADHLDQTPAKTS
jgi:aldehyde:ferredoxin oxidoreductase